MASHPQSEWLLGGRTLTTGSSSAPEEDTETQASKSLTHLAGIDALRRWCYALHSLLCILHLVLLAMLWHHPEHKFTLPFNNSVLSSGLSSFLQAFYTLYTALLVFMTQRLALLAALSRCQKLTTTHDISAAWSGIGTAILTLWRQTRVAASTSSTILVFLYLASVLVLHVASPTILQFQPYNASQAIIVTANSTWPSPLVNLSALQWGMISPIVPLMFNLGSSMPSTSGLTNNTLYSIPTGNQAIVNSSVNTSTIRTSCGLLPVLSATNPDYLVIFNASLGTLGNITGDLLAPWKDAVFLQRVNCAIGTCSDMPLVFLASTALELDSAIPSPVSFDMVWGFQSTGGVVQNSSVTVYPIACSLQVVHNVSTLDMQQDFLSPIMNHLNESPQRWSLWSPQVIVGGSASEALNSGILAALYAADFFLDHRAPIQYSFCSPASCSDVSSLDVYLMSLLGVDATANILRAPSESSAHPSMTLTPAQLENAISQVAAELIWLAGQLGENNGGFTYTSTSNDATELVLKWRLNIDKISVICTLSASLVLLVTAQLMIPDSPGSLSSSVDGISVLEILWVAAHTYKLQDKFCGIEPHPQELRTIGLFDICLATSNNNLERSEPLGKNSNVATMLELQDNTQAGQFGCKTATSNPWFILILPAFCYLLHSILVLVHLVLIAIFIKHSEHQVVIPLGSTWITTMFKAGLQLFYTLYTATLVFIAQYLAIHGAMTSRCNLTSVHDISCAWTGFGSAAMSVLQQRKGAVSFWMTLCIMAYFVCISLLHISSSTLLGFYIVNSTLTNTAGSRLAWPNSSVHLQDLNWTNIAPLVPVLEKLPGLSTVGLFSNMVYDVPSIANNSTSVNATVNVTSINAHCGLLSNVSFFPPGGRAIHFTTPSVGSVVLRSVPTWNNTITFVDPGKFMQLPDLQSCYACDEYLFFLVTATMDLNPTLLGPGRSISLWVDWVDEMNGTSIKNPLILTYVVGCSLDTTTTLDILDLQSHLLTGSHQSMDLQQWDLWSPSNGSELANGTSLAMYHAPIAYSDSNCPAGMNNLLDLSVCSLLTSLDTYIMKNLGINVTNSALNTGSAVALVNTISRSQFERVVSEVAARLIWTAGHVGSDGFEPAYGTSTVTSTMAQLQLNINIIPLSISLSASMILCLLLFFMIGIRPPRHVAISSLGVLETLWLQSNSQCIHERMLEVDEPTLDNLRKAGMFKICIADELVAKRESDEREPEENPLTSSKDN